MKSCIYTLIKITTFSLLMNGFSFAVSGQQITVAKIKKPQAITGQWQRISFIKNGIKSDLKSNYIFEFSPDATYLFIELIPIQSIAGSGDTIYTHKIIEKGKWGYLKNENLISLKGYTFPARTRVENELNDILSFKMDTKNKKQFSVKKLEGKDTIEYIYIKISDHYTYMANTQ
jgi:hypothetical protein